MKRLLLCLSFILLLFLGPPLTEQVRAKHADWTEKKLGKVILKADKAARQQKWAQAIKYGERALTGVETLNQHRDARYINQLKNLNGYYDKAKRLKEVAQRVKEAYNLSRKYLGSTHETTMISRTLYYKLLMSNSAYNEAIPLVRENISILSDSKDDRYRLLHYLKQLYSLYGITEQLEKEEDILIDFLEQNRRLMGNDDKDNAKVIWVLAQNYCRQRKLEEFKALIAKYRLHYSCK